ncbi:MAG: DUF262 domain-containing protein [Bacteroidetes bacterium]|nr:DUF262 domain-containing protein [Bacteroidota bacterium]
MVTKGHNIVTLNIESLLNGDDHYVIPVYQRNYAWKEEHISQLIQDIIDYIPKLGRTRLLHSTLVAYERKVGPELFCETIDGQQRVTTLTLLTSVIRHFFPSVALDWYKKINLDFASRKSSSETLHQIFMYGKDFPPDYTWNESIISGFELCKELLRKKLSENNITIDVFSGYLFSRVKILRVTVPEDTDLNHYFEIMNNRGEQLEKHEILKSKFLEILNELEVEERELALSVFNLIWEACSNMEKYIQYGFLVPQRNALFGQDDWNTLQPLDFLTLPKNKTNLPITKADEGRLSLTEIIQGKRLKSSDIQNDEVPERFNSVINFPNFLLHVLRIYTKKDIPLDDKRLISTFEAEIKVADDKIRFAQEFGYELLRCKFLFDKYIIKREFIGGIDRWSLKRMKWYKDNKVSYVNSFGAADDEANDENRSILMLLSMFHVSTPTLVYKHWLNAALLFVMQKNDFVEAAAYKNYLVATARSFVFDRFLNNSLPKDYFDIIYRSEGSIKRSLSQLNLKKLVFEEGIDNIVFNYLDYLLWEQHKNKHKQISQFEFSFRSSVEHYYPRHPMPGYKLLDEKALDSFGNLCLISHSKNSRLSNQPPIAKRSHYKKQSLDSIKQWVMMEEYNADEWDESSIAEHEAKMIELLTTDLTSDYSSIISSNKDGSVADNKAWRWFNQYKNDEQNNALLARAILCFGEIELEIGSTNYLNEWHPKYFLYDWDYIKTTDAFNLFCDYVGMQNPSGLSNVIQDNLKKNRQLQNDNYRYTFVKHPEIWEYSEQGYFTWVDEGKQILLHEKERNTENVSRDLIIHLLITWFENKYGIEVYSWREGFRADINFDQNQGRFILSTDDETKGDLIIECVEEGKIKCHIKPNRNASNSSFVQGLIEFGWQNIYENFYQRGGSSTLGVLTGDYESDFVRISEKLKAVISNGLKI